MPITPVNKVKNSASLSTKRKGGYAFWGDTIVTWGDSGYGWGSPFATLINKVKNILTPVNKVKN